MKPKELLEALEIIDRRIQKHKDALEHPDCYIAQALEIHALLEELGKLRSEIIKETEVKTNNNE